MVNIGEAGDGIFDFFGDFRFNLFWGGPWLAHSHGQGRNIDVWRIINAKIQKRIDPHDGHNHEGHEGRHWIFDGPGREVKGHTRGNCCDLLRFLF